MRTWAPQEQQEVVSDDFSGKTYSSPVHTYDKATQSWDPPSAPTGPTAPCPPGCETKPGHSIKLVGTPEQIQKLEAILDDLRKTPSGRKLLTDIDNAQHPVVMELKSTGKESSGETGNNPAVVTMDENLTDDNCYAYDKSGHEIPQPVDVTAAHELTHALNDVNGTSPSDSPGREAQAIEGENNQRRERTPPLTERDPTNHGGGYYAPGTKEHDHMREDDSE
jgi:hypothetical protein